MPFIGCIGVSRNCSSCQPYFFSHSLRCSSLFGEWPAFFGGSWHPVINQDYSNAKNVLSFVDGHLAFTKIYWDGVSDSEPCNYEPPAGYDYNWDGE